MNKSISFGTICANMSAEIQSIYFEGVPLVSAEPVWSYQNYFTRANSRPRMEIVLSGETADGLCETRFTPREFEVLTQLCLGNSNEQIALALTVGKQQIKNYVLKIGKKLGIYEVYDEEKNRGKILWEVYQRGFLRFEPRIPEKHWVGL